MITRRNFIGASLTAASTITLLPAVDTFASDNKGYFSPLPAKKKLRFALASDAHYGEPGTDLKHI